MRQPRIVLLQRVMLAQAHHVLSKANSCFIHGQHEVL